MTRCNWVIRLDCIVFGAPSGRRQIGQPVRPESIDGPSVEACMGKGGGRVARLAFSRPNLPNLAFFYAWPQNV